MSRVGNHDIAWIGHGYDLAGNRVWREDVLAAAQGTPIHLDEPYSYDDLHRLVDLFTRGLYSVVAFNTTMSWTRLTTL